VTFRSSAMVAQRFALLDALTDRVGKHGLGLSCRVAFLGLAIGASCIAPWSFVTHCQRNLTLRYLRYQGFPAAPGDHVGRPAIVARSHIYYFSARCAHVDLAMVMSVLAWRTKWRITPNLLRVLILSALILLAGFIRTAGALTLHLRGYSWLWAHDIPYAVLYVGLLLAAIFAAVSRGPLPIRDREKVTG
jgi:hypothetical protein